MNIINWKRIFASRAEKVAGRRIYAVKGRGSVCEEPDSGRLVLEYYPRVDSRQVTTVCLQDLQSGRSDDHWVRKVWSTVLLVFLAFSIPGSAFLDELLSSFVVLGESLGSVDSNQFFREFVLLPLVIVIAMTWATFTDLNKTFTVMSTDWENSIHEFLDNDMNQKLEGIRRCMLSFRAFIKWRRYMGYVAVPLNFIAILVLSLLIAEQLTDSNFIVWTRHELIAGGVFLGLYIVAMLRYLYMRWFYTDMRDPTLQLCVMMVEENRQHVAVLRRGGVQL